MLALRAARRIIVAVIGGTLLVVALVLLFVPGPGIAVLLLALAVLSAEFAWARRWLHRLKDHAEAARRGLGSSGGADREGGDGASEEEGRSPGA